MVVSFPVALFMLAQTAAAQLPPTEPTAAPATTSNQPAKPDACPSPPADARTIVICSQRPQGYRLNPDVMEARREVRSGGRPIRPGGTGIPDCAHVGPAPCLIGGIPIIGAALTALEMAKRAAKGEEIGSMFVTDPHPSEYQLYQMAKARREAEAENAAAAAAAAKAREAATAKGPPAATLPQPNGN